MLDRLGGPEGGRRDDRNPHRLGLDQRVGVPSCNAVCRTRSAAENTVWISPRTPR